MPGYTESSFVQSSYLNIIYYLNITLYSEFILPGLRYPGLCNKDVQYSTGSSAQCSLAAWMGGVFGREWIHGCVWLSPGGVHLKLSQLGCPSGLSHFCQSVIAAAQLCPTLYDPMDCSTPGFPVVDYLLKLAPTHVHWVNDAIQPFPPLSFPSPPTLNLPQHQGLFTSRSVFHIRWPKYWSFILSIRPPKKYSG